MCFTCCGLRVWSICISSSVWTDCDSSRNTPRTLCELMMWKYRGVLDNPMHGLEITLDWNISFLICWLPWRSLNLILWIHTEHLTSNPICWSTKMYFVASKQSWLGNIYRITWCLNPFVGFWAITRYHSIEEVSGYVGMNGLPSPLELRKQARNPRSRALAFITIKDHILRFLLQLTKNKTSFLNCSGMLLGGVGKVLEVLLGDMSGGVWDTFGRCLEEMLRGF